LKVSVALSSGLPEPLTYRAPDDLGLRPGSRVLVPLGRRAVLGWVLDLDSPYRGRLKGILGVVDDPFLPGPELLEFARLAAAAYFASAAALLDHSLPPSQKGTKGLRVVGRESSLGSVPAGELARLAAAEPLRLRFRKAAAETAPPAPRPAGGASRRLLLAEDPGGEYRRACAETLAQGRSVLLVVPDADTIRYWQERLPGVTPCHSRLTSAAREKLWGESRAGKPAIICGGLAALALPLAAPGLVILDRASSPLYARLQGTPFRLDHLAGLRAQAAGIPLLAGALAHTCSTWTQRQQPGVEARRPCRPSPPQVHPLKGRERGIPPALLELAARGLREGRRTLVLVNRIAPALHLFCEACSRLATCPRCSPALPADGAGRVSCRRCSHADDAPGNCRRCGRPLEPLHDISIESLARALERIGGEGAVLTLTAAEMRDGDAARSRAAARPLTLATLAGLSPRLRGLFAAAAWVKPESFFPLDEFDAAERIQGGAAEIAAQLAPGGELHVFSVFHFHYALRHLLDEERFFARELKYRSWFQLPPFREVYELELRRPGLRELAADMRGLYGRHRQALGIRRAHLVARQALRGAYRGVLELHADAGAIAAAGLQRLPRSSLRRVAG